MIQTIIAKPTGLLNDYVCYFAVQEFNTFEQELLKPMHAKHEIIMMFMINCKMHDFINNTHNSPMYVIHKTTGPDCIFSGLLTASKGSIVFKGHVKLLTIHFKPTGFYWLFDISPAEITNRLGASSDLFSEHVISLHEQLQEAKTSMEMFSLTENFLIERLQRQKTRKGCCSILKISEFLIQQPIAFSIEKFACQTCMSLKTLERKFLEQVGISPKLFERIRRFNKALDIKISQPKLSWTNICYQTGYYDQNHFIKDFTEFAGETPSSFFKNSFPLAENISSVFDHAD